jgi:hypothetical protein
MFIETWLVVYTAMSSLMCCAVIIWMINFSDTPFDGSTLLTAFMFGIMWPATITVLAIAWAMHAVLRLTGMWR